MSTDVWLTLLEGSLVVGGPVIFWSWRLVRWYWPR